ncbi:uncharacterized protein LOC117113861 [Anneissia japonica]|uniref:uncharacterized protein LOC117113861 n=1 Tax=Anneissia japonica TaxID=1529436 RepID=UPI0014259CC0|nr:uncharacterized protein LOC117113861 [Anneissia japonica]
MFALICVFFVIISRAYEWEPPTANAERTESFYSLANDEESSAVFHNTYNFYYGSGEVTNSCDLCFKMSFSQQEAIRRWQRSFDGMSGEELVNSVVSSTSPIQLTVKQECQLLTSNRGFFTPRHYDADAEVCTSILGASGDARRVGFSPPISGAAGTLDAPEGCSDLADVCLTIESTIIPGVALTVDGNVPVIILQLPTLGYNQEFLENTCSSESCAWPPFAYNGFVCLCCQETRGENALVTGLTPGVSEVVKIVITNGNCVAKLEPVAN